MIFIQVLRKNDINPNGGKQVEFGKLFFENFNWSVDSINDVLIHSGNDDIRTSLTVRGSQRGGSREGTDCKEYANSNGSFPLKEYLIKRFNDEHVGNVFMIFESLDATGKEFNLYFTPSKRTKEKNEEEDGDILPLQKIVYGAPGTGKSRGTNDKIHETYQEDSQEEKDYVLRTTFHPDYDYASFVGCYKPTMKEVNIRNANGDIIADATKEEKERIVYSFVPQVFTNAYVKAWKERGSEDQPRPVFLVIEEINRGNCAQIFGDLFQLLDRKDGYSEYHIKADEDLKNYLIQELGEDNPGIENGELCLPPNLYIWATMNTSDQSLFPMDSAFKRRWEWEYMPINTRQKTWYIKVNNTYYSWSSFLENINDEIWDITQSEDKKLGFFFCKADADDVVNAEKFVNKVIFYLWNDVFKDYEFDREIFKKEKADGDKKGIITFHDFFDPITGKVNENILERFLINLKVTNGSEEDEAANKKKVITVTLNGDTSNDQGRDSFDFYMDIIDNYGANDAGAIIEASDYYRIDESCKLATKNKDQRIDNSKVFSYEKKGDYFFVKGVKRETLVNLLKCLEGKIAGKDITVKFE